MASLRAQRFGWYMIDWAVSGFTTSVVTVFLGPYLTNVARAAANENGIITPFGIGIHPGSWFSFVVSMSVLVQVLALPVVGAIADRSHIKKLVFVVMSIVGSVATTLLYFLNIDDGNYLYGGFFFHRGKCRLRRVHGCDERLSQ